MGVHLFSAALGLAAWYFLNDVAATAVHALMAPLLTTMVLSTMTIVVKFGGHAMKDVDKLLESAQLCRILLVVCVMAIAGSVVCFSLQRILRLETGPPGGVRGLAPRRRWRRKAAGWQVVWVDALESVASGDCAICLVSLTDIRRSGASIGQVSVAGLEEASRELEGGHQEKTFGLLELPCKHVFHRPCIDRWFMADDKCPMCRSTVPGLEHCTCYKLRLETVSKLRGPGSVSLPDAFPLAAQLPGALEDADSWTAVVSSTAPQACDCGSPWSSCGSDSSSWELQTAGESDGDCPGGGRPASALSSCLA